MEEFQLHNWEQGQLAEPITLQPLVPLHLINGGTCQAASHSSNLVPHNPHTMLELAMRVVQGEDVTAEDFPGPFLAGFNGRFESNGNGAWRSVVQYNTQRCDSNGARAVYVHDIPHEFTIGGFEDKMKELKRNGSISSIEVGDSNEFIINITK